MAKDYKQAVVRKAGRRTYNISSRTEQRRQFQRECQRFTSRAWAPEQTQTPQHNLAGVILSSSNFNESHDSADISSLAVGLNVLLKCREHSLPPWRTCSSYLG